MTIVATMLPANCATVNIASPDAATTTIEIYPNPFSSALTIQINETVQNRSIYLAIYNMLGEEVLNKMITNKTTMLETNSLSSGIYFYKVIENNAVIQSGRAVSQQ